MKMYKLLVSCLLFFSIGMSLCSAETIILRSGNGAIGQVDPLITVAVEDEPAFGQAVVVEPLRGVWVAPIAGTKWVSLKTSLYGTDWTTYRYDIHFTIPVAFSAASVRSTYSADDWASICINGVWDGNAGNGEFTQYATTECSSASLFRVGDNVLSYYVPNAYSWTGLDFYSVISYTPVPEPSGLLIAISSLGCASVLAWRRRGAGPIRCRETLTKAGQRKNT